MYKLVQIKSDEVFPLLIEGESVYRISVNDGRVINLKYVEVDYVCEGIKAEGDTGCFIYYVIKKEVE